MSNLTPAEARARWAAALRSGEFKQGDCALRTVADEHCCLGVGCEVYRRETGQGEWRCRGGVWEFCTPGRTPGYYGALDVESGCLPKVVRDWLGVESSNPVLRPTRNGDSHSASSWNDQHDASFAQIADMIEETFK